MYKWSDKEYFGVEVLLGKILESVIQDDLNESGDRIVFTTKNGKKYIMTHDQDCCERVYVKDISGDLEDLIGSPITMAEASTNSEGESRNPDDGYWDESHTWTFYKFATQKGFVTISWYGTSNGYYSESVGFYQVK